MDANLAPLKTRLNRSEKMIKEASENGVELFLLPELFNIGYEFGDELFKRAESANGETRKFLARCAKQYNLMLGGTCLIKDRGNIFNRFMLFSPEGTLWQYDKIYPWGWERGYFKGGQDITIADTPIGRIGFLICWDVAHTKLWEAYKGKVDLILVSMSPPKTTDPIYSMADGRVLDNNDLGYISKMIDKNSSATQLFTDGPKLLAKTLGIPVISSSSKGRIKSLMPHPKALWLTYCATNPLLFRFWNSSKTIMAEFECVDSGQIINSKGIATSECVKNKSDSWVYEKISIDRAPKVSPLPIPDRVVPRLSYFLCDRLFNLASLTTYMKRRKYT